MWTFPEAIATVLPVQTPQGMPTLQTKIKINVVGVFLSKWGGGEETFIAFCGCRPANMCEHVLAVFTNN